MNEPKPFGLDEVCRWFHILPDARTLELLDHAEAQRRAHEREDADLKRWVVDAIRQMREAGVLP